MTPPAAPSRPRSVTSSSTQTETRASTSSATTSSIRRRRTGRSSSRRTWRSSISADPTTRIRTVRVCAHPPCRAESRSVERLRRSLCCAPARPSSPCRPSNQEATSAIAGATGGLPPGTKHCAGPRPAARVRGPTGGNWARWPVANEAFAQGRATVAKSRPARTPSTGSSNEWPSCLPPITLCVPVRGGAAPPDFGGGCQRTGLPSYRVSDRSRPNRGR